MIATCTNSNCPEQGIPKTGTVSLLAGEEVRCGHCTQPCQVAVEDQDE